MEPVCAVLSSFGIIRDSGGGVGVSLVNIEDTWVVNIKVKCDAVTLHLLKCCDAVNFYWKHTHAKIFTNSGQNTKMLHNDKTGGLCGTMDCC